MKRLFTFLFVMLSMMMVAQNIKKVAILETVDKEGTVPYGVRLQVRSSLTYAVNLAEGYEGLDRVDLESIMGEYNFQRTGMVNDKQIKKLGEMTGAQYVLITETAMYDKDKVMIVAKMLDVETGKIFSSAPPAIADKDPDQMKYACIKVAATLLDLPIDESKLALLSTKKREQEEKARLEAERNARETADEERKSKEAEAVAKANQFGSLFGQSGNTTGSGESHGDGQRGNPVGHGSVGGNSWSMAGRGIKGTLPMPSNDIKQEGKVIVQIRVNAAGQVVNATITGGDVLDKQTQQLALDAAWKARFTEGDHDQIGTITYIFKLN